MLEGASTPDEAGDIDVSNISDEQVDKFFESGGREMPADETVETRAPEGEPQEKPDEPQADQHQDEKGDAHKEKFVRYEALHEERMRRKEIAAELKTVTDKTARMEQTFQAMLRNAQQAAEPQAPSFEDDPIEALRVNQIRIERENRSRDEYLSQQAAQAEQHRRVQEFVGQYHESAKVFAKSQPDFSEAYNFLTKSRLDEHMSAGYTESEAKQLLQEDEAVIVSKAFKEGINPAERIYNLAKHRGYAHKANDEVAKGEQKMSQLEKGMQSAKSLSNVSGKSPRGSDDITLEALSHMDAEELAEYVSGKNWAKIAKQFR